MGWSRCGSFCGRQTSCGRACDTEKEFDFCVGARCIIRLIIPRLVTVRGNIVSRAGGCAFGTFNGVELRVSFLAVLQMARFGIKLGSNGTTDK